MERPHEEVTAANTRLEEKVAILRRHLREKEPISKLCRRSGVPASGLLPLASGGL